MAAAVEGVSPKVKLPGIMDFMQDTQPLFFPYGEQAAASVQITTESHYRALYLPVVCRQPLGLVWSTTIGFEDVLASIQSLKRNYQLFVQVLEALKPVQCKKGDAEPTSRIVCRRIQTHDGTCHQTPVQLGYRNTNKQGHWFDWGTTGLVFSYGRTGPKVIAWTLPFVH
jgi:hypothetical protein